MEAQLAALTEQLRVRGERQALLEQELGQRPPAAADPPGLGNAPLGRPTGVGVDTRLFGKPHDFSGKIDDWRDWSVVFEGYAAAAVPGLEAGMSRAVGAKAIRSTKRHARGAYSQSTYHNSCTPGSHIKNICFGLAPPNFLF